MKESRQNNKDIKLQDEDITEKSTNTRNALTFGNLL